ncbi:MAG: hypothetical protein WA840_18620 [Caulobacteraceae bacterium]
MDSRRKTGGDCGRLPAITRRSVFGATLATPTLGLARPAASGDALAHSKAWLAIDAEIVRLTLEWQAQESRLARDFNWLKLPEPERRSHHEARELYEINGQIEALAAQRRDLLDILERLPSTDLSDIAGKLAVAVGAMQGSDVLGFELLAQCAHELSRAYPF